MAGSLPPWTRAQRQAERGAQAVGFVGDHPGGFPDDLSIHRFARPPFRKHTEQPRQRLDPPQRSRQSVERGERECCELHWNRVP